MSNIAPIAYDADSEAYFKRYPELRVPLAQYGANGARLHWQNYGQKEGRTWGAAPVAAPTTPAAPVETVSTAPLPTSYGTDQNSWDAYLTAGRTATEGMNQMPGVFSDYGKVPIDDKAANALFYPSAAGASQAAVGNPLLAAAAGMGSGGAVYRAPAGSAGSMQGNALLSPSQRFMKILDMGEQAFDKPVSQWVDEQGGAVNADDFYFYNEGQKYYGR